MLSQHRDDLTHQPTARFPFIDGASLNVRGQSPLQHSADCGACLLPVAGRPVTSDRPLGLGPGDTNLYRYVRNQPTNSVDPTGLITAGPSEERETLSQLKERCEVADKLLHKLDLTISRYETRVRVLSIYIQEVDDLIARSAKLKNQPFSPLLKALRKHLANDLAESETNLAYLSVVVPPLLPRRARQSDQ